MTLRPFSWGRVFPRSLSLAVALLAGAACSSDATGVDGSEAPEGHTVRFDGVAHAPGAGAPQTNCVTCHGMDLRGGSDGAPSCFTCHGREW